MLHSRIEIERRVLKTMDDRAKAGLPQADIHILRAIVTDDMQKEAEASRVAAQEARTPKPIQAAQPAPPPRAVSAQAPKPPPERETATGMLMRLMEGDAKRPVLSAIGALKPVAETREQRRLREIAALTPAGAEAKRDKAIRSGMSVAEFEGNVAAWSILEAGRLARGR